MLDRTWIDRCPFCGEEIHLQIRTLDDIDKRHIVECGCGQDFAWEMASQGMRLRKYKLEKISDHGWFEPRTNPDEGCDA